MPEFATLDRLDPRGKTVLVRVDLNVPMKEGRVADRTRIDRVAGTLRELADRGGRVVVLSHFGRPKGKDPAMSLRPLAEPLSEAIGRPVRFASDCIGPEAERLVAELAQEGIVTSSRDGSLRVSAHAYNTPEDVKAVLWELARKRALLA